MKTLTALLMIALSLSFCSAEVAPGIEWQNSLGGSHGDFAYAISQNADGTYFVAGDSYSLDGDVTDHHGSSTYADAWLIKLDATGQLLWAKSYGGSLSDGFFDMKSTSDGGCIAAGYTYSIDGDVTDNHGGADYWVVKIDASGNIVWKKSFGGTGNEQAEAISATEGGYVVAGYSKSHNGDVTGNHGSLDYWVIKIDGDGNLVWETALGGTGLDWAKDIAVTAEGEYVVAGYSDSNNGDITNHHGSTGIGDFWVVKLSSSGEKIWQSCYGGTKTDQAQSLQLTPDGSIMVAGEVQSTDGDASGLHGGKDFWIIKLNSNGVLQWQKCYGGTNDERAYSIRITNDQGFIVAGDSYSSDEQVSGHHGRNDYWIVRLDADGNIIWQNSFGGSKSDNPFSVIQTFEGGYASTGWCNSNNGDITNHHGTTSYSDYWIVKLGVGCPVPTNLFASNITSSSAKLKWHIVTGAEGYKIRFKVSGTNEWTIRYSTGKSRYLYNLSPNTSYTWEVKTLCTIKPGFSSDWSAKQHFTTGPLRIGDESEQQVSFQIYPNPAEDHATIQFSLAQPSNVHIKVYDMSGKEITTLLIGNVEQGEHSLQLNTKHFSKGVYMVRMISDNGIESQKLIVQ